MISVVLIGVRPWITGDRPRFSQSGYNLNFQPQKNHDLFSESFFIPIVFEIF